MAKGAKSQEFMKAYPFLLKRTDLTSAEKLVMIVICRFWPNPYWDTNEEIARSLGFTERYIEKVAKSLADKGIIKRGYAHIVKNGRPHTVRVIVPKCFPCKSSHKIKWIKPEQMDGQQPEHKDGHRPNNSTLLPERQDDLLEKSRRGNKKASPTLSPADVAGSGDVSGGSLKDVYKKMEPQKLLAEYEKGGFNMEYIDRNCPELVEKARKAVI